jgi:hypothetical protein
MEDEPGSDMPRASIAEDMVFAVYICKREVSALHSKHVPLHKLQDLGKRS